jgi:hypothetical protein
MIHSLLILVIILSSCHAEPDSYGTPDICQDMKISEDCIAYHPNFFGRPCAWCRVSKVCYFYDPCSQLLFAEGTSSTPLTTCNTTTTIPATEGCESWKTRQFVESILNWVLLALVCLCVIFMCISNIRKKCWPRRQTLISQQVSSETEMI